MYNIIVCDDERDIVSALEIYLTAEGYHVLRAENGREALALANSEDAHLMSARMTTSPSPLTQ